MAGDSHSKTEQPTGKRLEKARTEGNFPVSKEFVASLQFLIFVVLLTNRVHPTRANEAIKQVRRAVHDAVLAELR